MQDIHCTTCTICTCGALVYCIGRSSVTNCYRYAIYVFATHLQHICAIFIVHRQPEGGAGVHCGGGQEQVGPEQGQVRVKKIITICKRSMLTMIARRRGCDAD